MRVSAAGYSKPGPRPTNQDSFFVDHDLGLFVVADGMGGHNAGEVASQIAVDAVVEFIRSSRDARELTWPFGYDTEQSLGVNRITAALKIANRRVHEAGQRNVRQSGMGTTIVALLVEGNRMVIGHAGDSRAYRLRNTHLEQMTVDDTWVNAMLGAGAPTAANHPMRHVLTSGIGMRPDVTPTVRNETIAPREVWLMSSDGVHGYVTPLGLAQAIMGEGSPRDAAQRAVEAALKAPTSDNSTAVVIAIDG